ncbi:uncharacterized protein ACA1_247620 [Acanthamoeba castellanii str. Neff]|uniref:Uncharacterized protein n=1 Tax=Acanthamoeba castellanii (strain ATCC 30010 / Neff) TaxID=1257118 RepID=L8GKD3_ACACF|nr:uncharacterized protein ACA1_247620 [Acanthamoeba castellanii str. Neff]ELR13535.1 hypothetical protein ACA1_247620 [Acanthamoeba castellanii str. Neff]
MSELFDTGSGASAFDVFNERVVPRNYIDHTWSEDLYRNRSRPDGEQQQYAADEAAPLITFDEDPRRYDLRASSEAGALWDEFPPEMGPTLRRGGAYIPLYPLDPELFRPEKTTNAWEDVYGEAQRNHDRPVTLNIGDRAREQMIHGAAHYRRSDEGQEYANGDMFSDGHERITSAFRPFIYAPQRSVPIEYREGGADLAGHQRSADRVAPFGFFTEARNASVRDAHRAAERSSGISKGPHVHGEVRHPLRHEISRAASGVAHAALQHSEAVRERNVDADHRAEIFNPLQFNRPDRGADAAKEAMRGNALTLRAYQDRVNIHHYGAPASRVRSVGPGAMSRDSVISIPVMKELTAGARRVGNAFADATGGSLAAAHNMTDVFTYNNTQKLAASVATAAGQGMALNNMPAIHNVLMPFTTDGSVKLYAAGQAMPTGMTGAYNERGHNAYYNTEVFINPFALKQATETAYAGYGHAGDPNGGAVRNVLMPFTTEASIKQATDHSSVAAPGNGAYGDPALYSAAMVASSGDMIKSLGGREGISHLGNGVRAHGTVTDENINPRYLDHTNRDTYSEFTHAGGAGMSRWAPIGSEPLTLYDVHERTVSTSTLPDASMLAAFQNNPLVPVPVRYQ